MANFVTTDFLNLRKQPLKQAGNVLAVMPPDTIVEEIDVDDNSSWRHVKTVIGNVTIIGYASKSYLKSSDTTLSTSDNAVTKMKPVHYPAGSKIITRDDTVRLCALNEPGLIKTDLSVAGDPAEHRAQIRNVLNFLDVEHSPRYARTSTSTFCNIYAYDVAYCLGAFLPRVWWTNDALTKIAQGEDVKVLYDQTVTELTANRITDWFEKFGAAYGWKRIFDLTTLQTEANKGKLCIIVGQRINMNNSGHIDAVVPETETFKAVWNNQFVTSPLQSQAGAKNKKYFTGVNWWEDHSRFKKFGFWCWSPDEV